LDIVFPAFPPSLDGIGDHTALLAQALAPHTKIRVLTAERDPRTPKDIEVLSAFSIPPAHGIFALKDVLAEDTPDWLLVQYNPFSYGRWGLNPSLPFVLWQIQRQDWAPRLAVMVHEPFVPGNRWQEFPMATWQRSQLWALAQLADVVFFSIAPWAQTFQRWFPDTPVHHLPVSSNIPRVQITPAAARDARGIPSDVFVIGLFGSAHPSRLLHFVKEAAQRIQEQIGSTLVLYVGNAGDTVRQEISDIPVLDSGPLPAAEVSRCFSCMDLYLAPFRKGVSTRRGSFMTGIQHGIPTVTTEGIHTDALLREEAGRALILTPDNDPQAFSQAALNVALDPTLRDRMGQTASDFFERNFSWNRIAHRLLHCIHETEGLSENRVT